MKQAKVSLGTWDTLQWIGSILVVLPSEPNAHIGVCQPSNTPAKTIKISHERCDRSSRYLAPATTTQHWLTVRPAVAIWTPGCSTQLAEPNHCRAARCTHEKWLKNEQGQCIAGVPGRMPKNIQKCFLLPKPLIVRVSTGFDTPCTCPNNLEIRTPPHFAGYDGGL